MSNADVPLTPIELIQASPLAMALYDNTGAAIAFSERWCALLPPYDDTQPNYDAVMKAREEQVRRAWKGETCLSEAFQVIGVNGQARWVQVERGPWRGTDGKTAYVMGHARDVTEEHEARRAAERSHERLAMALRSDKMMVVETNIKTSVTTVLSESDELKEILRASVDLDHIHPEDRPAVIRRLRTATPEELTQVHYNEYRLADSPDTWISTVSRAYLDEEGALDHMVLVFQDITERVLARKDIERVAFTDALTGLPNRAKFQLEFGRAVAEAETTGRPMGMIMVDVDHFKDINDTLGHDAGDALLKNLAAHLRGAFREGDVIARLGGDEFAILLQDVATEDDLMRPLAVVREALERPIEYKGQGVKISTSVGAALHNDADVDPETVLKNADIALYQAKAQGRNCVVLFQAQMRTEVEQRLELLRDVRAAIPRGEFILFYQPVVDLSQPSVSGFEALMRWNHPDHGVLTPSYFMAALEDPDLSLQLGDVTIETALRQMKAWLESGIEFGRLSINLASSQFRTGRLARQLEDRMKFWGVPPSRLTVEVTENVYLGWGAEIVAETVRALHDLGVTIALDDFGTGYASLANLRQFPIDRLKIDKSFVQNIDDDAIVRAVINLGASMGMEVVAEGVERPEQLAALAQHGCTQVQGFHLAHPMRAVEVQTYLKAFAGGSASQDAA